jgi:UDP-GlcNAc:undecaprenyl-phosphate GlcNAc-1-phosphate transferase
VILIITFVVATVASLGLGAIVRRVAPAIGAVVPPRIDRWHEHATPTMGGVAIASATALALLVTLAQSDFRAEVAVWLPVVLAAGAMFFVGVLDDRLQLSPLAKLVSSLIVGAFLVFALAGSELGGLPLGDTVLAIVWFAGVCHALNLLDNMDGLAAGVGLIAAGFMAVVFGGVLSMALVGLLVALSGALLGFFYWNRSRARLFMGDCGSLFIGAVLAGVSLVPVFQAGDTLSRAGLMAGLILVVPLFDTSFVLVLRRLAGRPATRGGTDHVSHRFVSLGFSDRSAVRILYLVGLGGGATALALESLDPDVMLPVVALFAVLLGLLGIYLARVPAYDAGDFLALQKSSFAPFLKDLTFRWHAGQVILDLVLISACYYFAYWLRFPDIQFAHFLPIFGASLPAVLGLKLASLYISGLYQRSWQTFGLRDIAAVLRGVGLGTLLSVLAVTYLYRFEGFSRVVFVLDALLLTAAVLATRAFFPAMDLMASARSKRSRRVLVYGAGAFGQLLVREMRANPDWQMNPVAFIDDDPAKLQRWIGGVPVRGALDVLDSVLRAHQVDEVIVSSSSVSGDVEQQIRSVCADLQLPVRRLKMEIS